MQNFRSTVHMVYHKHGLHYNVLSGLIIIIFSRSKRVNKNICLCTRSDGNLLTCSSLELRLVRFVFSKEEEEDEEEEEEEDEESVKICISYLV